MATTRTQSESNITWDAAQTKAIPADGALVESDDFQVSGDMIAIGGTVKGLSAGAESNDVLIVHCRVKKTTYDTSRTFRMLLDCSSGSYEQESIFLPNVMAGDVIRFACSNTGTHAITVSILITEDKITF
jgi:hypothetical protein